MAETFSDRLAILARVSPNALTADSYVTDVIDMSKWKRVAAILATGDVGNNGTIQVTAQANTTNAASGGTTITGKTFTASKFTGSGSGTAGASYGEGIIEITDEDVRDALDGARYLYLTLTVGTATSDAGLIVLGVDPRYAPASEYDLASVKEIIQ
jgi:hypothetical protein